MSRCFRKALINAFPRKRKIVRHMTISKKFLTYDLLLGAAVAAWSNSDIWWQNFTKSRPSRHQTFGFTAIIVHCTLTRRAAGA